MKTLYLIGGTMGVGKTTACRELQKLLPGSVFLDGDWCWDMHPFAVTPETKAVVMDNICACLNNFLKCPAFEHVIFCWVMHRQDILDDLLSRLDTAACRVRRISLVCTPGTLAQRLEGDIQKGLRREDVLPRSLERLPLYAALDTEKIDTTGLTGEDVAEKIGGIAWN